MKKTLLFIAFLLMGASVWAQNTPPSDVAANALSYDKIRVSWDIPDGTTQPTRLNLFDQAHMVTHPGAGANGADVSAMYGGQGYYGISCNATEKYWVADDFTLASAAQIREIEFYSYQTGSTTTSTFTACYVNIYDTQPLDSTVLPIWSSDTVSCMTSSSWTGIYRTTATDLINTERPIMRIVAGINTTLPAGNYWVSVCFSGSLASGPWANPVAILGQISTGNAIQYVPDDGTWGPWADNTSLEQMGMPFIVRGEFVSENLRGFNVYKNNEQLNSTLIEGFYFVDDSLEAETEHCYTVEAVYTTGSAMSESVCATTPYNPCRIVSMPYSESFDTYGTGYSTYPNVAYPTCWSKINTTTATSTITLSYPYITTTNHSAPGSLYMYASSGYHTTAITPLIDSNSIAINMLRATMMLYKSSANYNIVIGTIVDPDDPDSFEPYDTLTPSTTSSWQQFQVDFNNYTGNAHYIALRSGSGSALNAMYVDDFTLDFTPDCDIPSNLHITSINSNSITLSWTPATITPSSSWDIEYQMDGDDYWLDANNITSPSYTIDNLEANTSYTFTFRVRSHCGEEYESAWIEETFTVITRCTPISEFPYIESFDSYGTTAYVSYPTCWSKINTTTSTSTTTQSYPYINTTNYSAPGSLYFYTTSEYGAWAITPYMDIDINTLQVDYKLRKTSSNYNLLIGVISNPLDPNTFVVIDTVSPTATSTWESFTTTFESYTGDGHYIAFASNTGTTNYMSLDDVVIGPVQTCFVPTNLALSETSQTTADLVWNLVDENASYELRYKLQDDSVWTPVAGIEDTTYTLTGLTVGTYYDVQVRTVCSDANSYWSETFNFHTACDAVSELPYFEGFEDYGYSTAGSEYPTCWSRPVSYSTSTTTAPFCNTSQKNTGNASLRFQACTWAATPQFDEDIHNLQVSFWLREEGPTQSGVFQVGVMSNVADTSTFELVETIHPGALEDVWLYYEVNFNNTQLTGTGNAIVFRQANTTYTNWYYWLDDVEVHLIPTCLYPGNLSSSEATQNSITLHWSDNNDASASFTVRYRPIGAEEWAEEIVYDTMLTLSSLAASSAYEWQVKARCSDVDESVWSVTVGQFITECGPISSFPYHETFDVYGTGYSGYPNVAYPTCWSKFNNTTATSTLTLSYPYLNSSYSVSAPAALYMYAASGYYTMAMLPPIDSLSDVEVNQLQISFMGLKTSAAYNVVVGVMTNPGVPSTFVPLDTVSPSATSTWELFEIPLSNYEGTGRYITFRCGSGTATNGIYIDNVTVDYIPTCFRPTDVTITQISQEEATVSWNANGNESVWQLKYKSDADEEWTEIPSLTENTYTFTGLTANTSYQVMVKALCDDGQESEFSVEKSFTTLCEPMEELPFTENFDSYASGTAYFPNCWIRQTNSTTNYPYISSSYFVSPGLGLYFNASATTYCYAALPQLPEDVNVRELQVSLMARKGTTATYKLELGMMTDPYDMSTYTVIQTISPAATSTWEPFTIYLNSYQGDGRFIVLKTPADAATTFYVDDIEVDYAPECLLPTHVHITNVTSSEATVNWSADENETDWQIVYGPAGFSMDTIDPITITVNPFTLTNLQPNTTYDVYLRTLCNNGEISEYTDVASFTTGCAPMDLPYSENFDNYGTGTSAYPDCWQKINNNTSLPYIYSMTASTGLTLPGALYMYTTSTTKYAYAILPEFDAELNTLQMSFAFKAAMGNGYLLEVGVLEDLSDTSSFVLVETIEPRTSVWNNFTVAFTSYEGTGKYIAIRSQRDDATNICYIDNLVVDYAPGCVAPMHLSADNITLTSADVTWRPGRDESEWIVAYGPRNFHPNVTGISQNTMAFPLSISDLEPGTFYDFYVKAVCDEEDYSAWSMKGSFRTDCLLVDTLPYTESFDTYGTGTIAFPNCWNRNTTYSTTIQYPYINTTNNSAPGSLYFYSSATTYNYVTLPEFDESIDISALRANFKLRKTSAAYQLKVGVMTDPYDKNTFVEVARVSPSNTSTWEDFRVYFYNYTGEGHFIAFASDTSATNSIYLDDLSIDFAPTCLEVENVYVSDIGITEATISWTPVSEGISWNVEYGPAGFEQGSAAGTTLTVQDTFVVLSNLTSASLYDVYVKQICGADDESPWSDLMSFATNCTPMTLPYAEDFDNYTTSATSTTAPNDYPNDQLPICWTFLNRSTSSSTYPMAFLTSYSSYAVSGNCLFFKSSSSTPLYAILPKFTNNIQTLTLRFTYRNEGESTSNGNLSVGYMTDPSDATTFTELSTFPQIITLTTDSVNFNNVPSSISNANIAFKYTGGSSNNYYLSIDNVYVTSYAPPVEDPTVTTGDASGITQTTATLNANITNPDDVTITAKGFEWKATHDSTYTQITGMGSGNNFTASLTGLTPNTSYTYKAYISYNDITAYGSEEQFTTLDEGIEPCDAPTNLQVTNITQNSATVSWTAGGSENSWKVQYKLTDESQWQEITVQQPTCVIEGLTAESTYELRVKAVCESTDSDPVSTTFTTQGVGIDNIRLANSIILMPNPADNHIELRVNSNVDVKEAVVFNAFCQTIQTVELTDNHARIDLSNMAAGMYFVRVNGEGVTATKKFVRK